MVVVVAAVPVAAVVVPVAAPPVAAAVVVLADDVDVADESARHESGADETRRGALEHKCELIRTKDGCKKSRKKHCNHLTE